MANEDPPPLPSFSGGEDSLYGSFRRERADKLGGFKRESIKVGTGGAGFFSGGLFSSGGMRLQLGVALTLSIAAGSLAGAILGGKSGVKSGLEAGSRLDAAMLAPRAPSNAEVAAQTIPTRTWRACSTMCAACAHRSNNSVMASRPRDPPTARGAGDGARRQSGGAAAGARQTTAALARSSTRSTRGWPDWSAPASTRRPSARSPSPHDAPEEPTPENFAKSLAGSRRHAAVTSMVMC